MKIPRLLESPHHCQWDAERIAGNWLKTGYSEVTRATRIKRLQESGVSLFILQKAIQMAGYAVAARNRETREQQAAAQAAQEQQFKAKLAGKVV